MTYSHGSLIPPIFRGLVLGYNACTQLIFYIQLFDPEVYNILIPQLKNRESFMGKTWKADKEKIKEKATLMFQRTKGVLQYKPLLIRLTSDSDNHIVKMMVEDLRLVALPPAKVKVESTACV